MGLTKAQIKHARIEADHTGPIFHVRSGHGALKVSNNGLNIFRRVKNGPL